MERAREVHPTDRRDLFRTRLAVPTSETEGGRRMDAGMVKRLTGMDRIRARRMHENFRVRGDSAKFWLGTNHRSISGKLATIFPRGSHRPVPFEARFGRELGTTSHPRIEAAGEGPGILRLASPIERGNSPDARARASTPSASWSATDAYRADPDTVGRFLADFRTVDSAFSAQAGPPARGLPSMVRRTNRHAARS